MSETLSQVRLRDYVLSCGLLTIPILVWNMAFAGFLPPALGSQEFSRDIPLMVTYGENLLRLIVLILPFLMPLDLTTVSQQRGLKVFVAGMILYFLSWLALIIFPHSQWSLSCVGFLAPAYTPLLWLAGLGLIGRRLYWPGPYRWWMYLWLAAGFTAFHVAHTSIVYERNY
jgi:hypothetical protein